MPEAIKEALKHDNMHVLVMSSGELQELAAWIQACKVTTHRPTYPEICQWIVNEANQ